MPKPPRSRRRGRPRPVAWPAPVAPTAQPSPITPIPTAASPAAEPAVAVAPAKLERERSISRFTARDYSYVKREMVRIVIFALAMFVIIVVLSFFLP